MQCLSASLGGIAPSDFPNLRTLSLIMTPLKLLSVKTWKITLEYDGSKYRGWQEQRNARTVMGELRQAAEDVFAC